MSLEQTLNRLGIHTHQKVVVAAPEIVTPEAQVIKKDLTPWDFLNGENQIVEQAIAESLELKEAKPSGFLPIADQPEGQLFVCRQNDAKQAAFWLNPEKWYETMKEFGGFIRDAGAPEGLKVEVKIHEEVGNYPNKDWILVSPVLVRRGAHSLGTEYAYGLGQEGRVSLAIPQLTVVDLGYLNPNRVKREMLENLRAEMGR
jgi:hypothetical protein